ncbi:histidinol-phosphate transaminase [Magnetofaba australis]|nr:histidinol-phosphate transaminase [Magnetofaba australis]
MDVTQWTRPAVLGMAGYAPGEQPQAAERVIKLNTNENPYAPPQAVLDAMGAALGDALRLYPEPDSRSVREAAARAYGHGLQPQQVVAGNGSDDLLTIILRTFVDPGETVAALDPTYTLYEPLVTLQGGRYASAPWREDGGLPVDELAGLRAKVIFVTRPNAPTGHVCALSEVVELCTKTQAHGVVVLDEAYGDFADDHGLGLLPDCPNLIVTRSFSKSMCLAGARIGLGFMSVAIAEQMHKVRDSYNLDRVAQVAATAALDNLDAYAPLIAKIKSERARLTAALRQRGFDAPESQANFVLAKIPAGALDGRGWLAALRQKGILVRYFGHDPRLSDKLRITVGAPHENDALLAAVDGILVG